MATGVPQEIPLYVEKIHQAAFERQSTQELLESDKDLSGSERFRAEARVRKYNDDIATYAEKINVALKALAKSDQRIDPIRVQSSISDPQLAKYLLSVKNTVAQLGESRMKELSRVKRDEKQLEIRIDEAQRVEKASKKAIEQLRSERKKVKKELTELDRTLADRKRQVAPVTPRIKQAKEELKKVRAELKKLETKRHEMKREREGLERRKAQLDLKRKNEPRGAERVQMRKQSEELKAKLEQSVAYDRDHIEFRHKELTKIETQLIEELRKLEEAKRASDTDLKKVEEERARLQKIDEDAAERERAEEERLQTISKVQTQLAAVAAEPS